MDIDDLYGAPLEQFVPERTALARELRKQGRRDDATTVAALRKPSVAAWAVNQLVRTQVKSVNELFGAGDALRRAHEKAASGGGGGDDASALRDAARRQRDAVDTLLEAARGLLSSEGHELSPATIDRVTETLQAAALDEEARASVQEGRLERELRHVGLGLGLGLGGAFAASPAPAKQEPKAKPKPKPEPKPKPKQPKRDVERERKRKAAKTTEATARRELDRTRRAVESARARRDSASSALEDAEQALAQAESHARGAEQAHKRASDALERI